MKTSRPGLAWGIFVVSLDLAANLLFCFVVFPTLMDSGVTRLDPDGYGSVGRALYETGRFETITKAPLYPAFIALASLLTGGYRVWGGQATQSLLATFTCALLYATFQRVLEERTARRAGLACALFPMLIWYTPRLWTETFLTFVLAGSLPPSCWQALTHHRGCGDCQVSSAFPASPRWTPPLKP